MKFSKYFDHTLLKPEASESQIRHLCKEALEYDFYSVCVNSCHVALAAELVSGSGVKVAAVVGFPLGAMSMAAKVFETRNAVENGAGEIDMVLNVGALKEGRYDYVQKEIAAIADVCHTNSASLKVIFETCLLTDDEIIKACELSIASGADFIKTSTGFSTGGATAEHVKLMAYMAKSAAEASSESNKSCGSYSATDTVPDITNAAAPMPLNVKVQVKASGGIRTLADAQKFIEAGADRLGCSASVAIMKEYEKQAE